LTALVSIPLSRISAAALDVLRALVTSVDAYRAPGGGETTPTDARAWAQATSSSIASKAPVSGSSQGETETLAHTASPFPALRQSPVCDVAEALLRGGLLGAELPLEPHLRTPRSSSAQKQGEEAISPHAGLPLPLPLSPVNSPEDAANDNQPALSPPQQPQQAVVAMPTVTPAEKPADAQVDSPLVVMRATRPINRRRVLIDDSDSEDAGAPPPPLPFADENADASSSAMDDEAVSQWMERTPLAELPVLDDDEDTGGAVVHDGMPAASPGPEVVDVAVAASTAQDLDDDDDDSPAVVFRRRAPLLQDGSAVRRRVVIADDSDEDKEEVVVTRSGEPQQEVICIEDNNSDSSPLVAPPRNARQGAARGRLVVVVDDSSDEDGDVRAAAGGNNILATTPVGTAASDAGDPFTLRTPTPGGSIANLPSPAPSPAWVAPRTAVKGSGIARTPAPGGTASSRKPPLTPAGSSDDVEISGPQFTRQREVLTARTFAQLNAVVFSDKLPQSLADTLLWNAKLKTTAGVTYTSRQAAPPALDDVGGSSSSLPFQMVARIELSTHVVDNSSKLRQTLCHEMCHAAAWLIDGVSKPPHGPAFRAWASRAMAKLPGLDVSTCHSYDIAFKFNYQCTTLGCGSIYGRHSDSINTARQVCGLCGGPLRLMPRLKADGTPVAKRAPTAFSLFVKERFASVKSSMPLGTKQGDIMKRLAEVWREEKAAAATNENDIDDAAGALRAIDLNDA
jgi:predicted SprT family Zn-dependent metalloprotease